jgi:hypothetical protein
MEKIEAQYVITGTLKALNPKPKVGLSFKQNNTSTILGFHSRFV